MPADVITVGDLRDYARHIQYLSEDCLPSDSSYHVRQSPVSRRNYYDSYYSDTTNYYYYGDRPTSQSKKSSKTNKSEKQESDEGENGQVVAFVMGCALAVIGILGVAYFSTQRDQQLLDEAKCAKIEKLIQNRSSKKPLLGLSEKAERCFVRMIKIKKSIDEKSHYLTRSNIGIFSGALAGGALLALGGANNAQALLAVSKVTLAATFLFSAWTLGQHCAIKPERTVNYRQLHALSKEFLHETQPSILKTVLSAASRLFESLSTGMASVTQWMWEPSKV